MKIDASGNAFALHEEREMDKHNQFYQWNPSKEGLKKSHVLVEGHCLRAIDEHPEESWTRLSLSLSWSYDRSINILYIR